MDEGPPVLVIENDDVDEDAVRARLERDGWDVRDGWELPPTPWNQSARRIVFFGDVATRDDAVLALIARIRGAGLVVRVRLDDPLRNQFLGDLRRTGAVLRANELVTEGEEDELSSEERRLLTLIADGATVADAARELHLSKRTAERRLTQIRGKLNARTTAEAISKAGIGL